MSDSAEASFFNKGRNLEKMKEQMKTLNSSLEKTRLELSKFFLEGHTEADLTSPLQKEVECKAHLEALEKLIAE